MEAAELESEGDIIPAMNAQSQTVRKNISLKLKGKGRGRGGRKGGRGKKEPVAPTAAAVVVKLEPKEDDVLKENLESEPIKFDEIEEDIFKLEAPTFTTIDRGPPEPVHRNVKLRWDYKVHLIGTKMMNPLIHCCKKCSLPILSYGRMIPCKHVFCYECGLKSEKLCPRCDEKVNRVEQVGLGQLFMCIYGALRRNGSDGCCRTYLSQRDLQAHINHRHLRQPVPASTSSMTSSSSTTAKGSTNDSGGGRSSSANTSSGHHHSGPPPDYRMRGQSRSQAALDPYRTQMSGSIIQQQQQQQQPPQIGSFGAEVHRNYDRPNQMSGPPPIMSPYSLAVVSQSLSSVGVPPPICVPVATAAGAVAVSAYGSSPIPVVSVAPSNVVPQSRTNLITVPIHDDSAAGTPPTEYIPNYHQRASVPPPVPQPNYLQQMVAPPYSTPPPVSYPATYCTPTIVTTFTHHYPPPPIYSSQVPPPTLTHHQGPPRFMAPPPQRYSTPSTQQTQYEDHSHLGSPQYPPPPSPWPSQQRTSGPPPQHQLPLGPPPTARPPFY